MKQRKTAALAAFAVLGLAAHAANASACTHDNGGTGVLIGSACIDANDEVVVIKTEEAVDLSPLAGGTMAVLVLSLGSGTDLSVLADLPNLRGLEISETDEASIASLPLLPQLVELSLHTRGGLPSGLPTMAALEKLDLYVVEDFSLDFVDGMSALDSLRITSRKKRNLSDLPFSPSLTKLTAKLTIFDNVAGVAAAPNLEEVRLTRFDRTSPVAVDFAPFASLSKLTSLWLDGFVGAKFSSLMELTWLRRFECRQCDVDDASFVAPLRNLINLSLYQNRLEEISPLAALSKLRVLILSKNPVADLAPLRGMPDLSNIQLRHTKIRDLSPLRDLRPNVLWVDRTAVSDLSPLADYREMLGLSIRGTAVTDLSPIAGIKIKHLNIRQTGVTDTSMISEKTKILR